MTALQLLSFILVATGVTMLCISGLILHNILNDGKRRRIRTAGGEQHG